MQQRDGGYKMYFAFVEKGSVFDEEFCLINPSVRPQRKTPSLPVMTFGASVNAPQQLTFNR